MAKTVEDYEREIQKLKAKKADLKNKEKKQERTARTHALIVMGGLVEKYAGSWKGWDWDEAETYFARFQGAMKSSFGGVYSDEPLQDTAQRCREFERPKKVEKVWPDVV